MFFRDFFDNNNLPCSVEFRNQFLTNNNPKDTWNRFTVGLCEMVDFIYRFHIDNNDIQNKLAEFICSVIDIISYEKIRDQQLYLKVRQANNKFKELSKSKYDMNKWNVIFFNELGGENVAKLIREFPEIHRAIAFCYPLNKIDSLKPFIKTDELFWIKYFREYFSSPFAAEMPKTYPHKCKLCHRPARIIAKKIYCSNLHCKSRKSKCAKH